MQDFSIHYHLYDIRVKQKLSERKLAELSGVSKSEINYIEDGIKHPTVLTLCLLSRALNVSPYELFSMEIGECPQ